MKDMMLKSKVALCLIILLFSCKDDEGLGECALINCAAQTFALEYVDVEGNNLIANNYYPLENITITKDGEQLNFGQQQGNEVVYFFVAGTNGSNTYNIKLNDTETDELILDLSRIKSDLECCGPYFTVNSSTYNDETIEIAEGQNSFIEKITIVKP
jgi:hypothetical protein